MDHSTEGLLTAEEAAARLGVTRSYLYRLIKRGSIAEAVGIRGGREVKLIPASALERLNAAEGLLVRDVDESWAGPPPAWTAPAIAPTPAPGTAPPRAALAGPIAPYSEAVAPLTGLRPPADPPVAAHPSPAGTLVSAAPAAASLAGHSPDTGAQLMLISELREELRRLRDQLTEERAARQELDARLTKPAPVSDELASALSRANEVTALVRASEIKQQRFFETLLEERRWGRARRITYVAYLVITSAAGIAAMIWIYRMAAQLEALLAR